ncbi:MAG: tRNA (adenosine(37)-N6)-dimethylallyltransferase MiaA [Candidatus Lumbricidophila eiseniae]|uniref:tRNA dimethylallyltransferase n=1 Tax=Candidatus Lumbricidiphila eiseniae TaxID=1969409 RepID=A0A2A6FQ53_9MICO|nr:MAG: tRNA (adenosine(37)-N6)-dimethylallyltransferase MiaA [Candidatus Lumbricidophila eiseniae]
MTGNLIAIVGATGTGKSDFALDLAENLDRAGHTAEVVNADAMQLYRGMNIGTAKLPIAERRGIPHHLLDVLDVTEEASAAHYQPKARCAITEILARGHVALLVGGSGLYVSSVLYDFQFPATDPAVRAQLESDLAREGTAALYARLAARDPAAAAAIDPKNLRRIIRALEVLDIRGEPKVSRLPDNPVVWHPHHLIHLRYNRSALIKRLDRRVEQMWHTGLVSEVAELQNRGLELSVTASRAIGYAQALAQLHGTLSQIDAIEQTQTLTRRYARRQVSWFNRDKTAINIETDDATSRRDIHELVLREPPTHRERVASH